MSTSLKIMVTLAALFAAPAAATLRRPAPVARTQHSTLFTTLATVAEVEALRRTGQGTPSVTPRCDVEVAFVEALVDPDTVPDREGELVRIVRAAVQARDAIDVRDAVTLRDWALVGPRRRQTLGEVLLVGATPVTLGRSEGHAQLKIPLSNRRGWVALVDPCGVERARLTWGGGHGPGPGDWLVPVRTDLERLGPVRAVRGDAPTQKQVAPQASKKDETHGAMHFMAVDRLELST